MLLVFNPIQAISKKRIYWVKDWKDRENPDWKDRENSDWKIKKQKR